MKTYSNKYLKIVLAIGLCIFSFGNIYSQVRVDFTPRTSSETPGQTIYSIKGDFTLIGNSNLTLQNYSNTTNNSDNTMVAIDADGTNFPTTNSSSATLGFSSENGAVPECSTIIYAGLYWTARTNSTPTTLQKRTIKFRHADNNSYQTVVADADDIYYPGDNNMYAAFAEVTDIVRANGLGEYFAADIALTTGNGGNTGYYGGWSMVVVYENPVMKWRDVTVFDGYAYLVGNQTTSETLQVNGFNAIQNGPVNMKLGLVAGEGDVGISGDYFEIRNAADTNWVRLNHSGNTTGNFFNSSIQTGGNARNPSLQNNTGLDISMFNINNPGNSIIANAQTSTSFRYGSTRDTYIIFQIAMAIDAFVPSTSGELGVSAINGVTNISEPYTINPGETVEYGTTVANNGSEALTGFMIEIPIPQTAEFVPGSIQYQVFAPATTTSVPYFDPNFGINGAVRWDVGDLPLSTSPSDILLALDFDLQASTDCAALNPPNCNPTITLASALMSGTGAVSGSPFFIKYVQGYETTGNCIGNPIVEPIVITVIPELQIDVIATNLTVECDGNGNIDQVNDWLTNAANASVLGSCVVSWTNDYTGVNSGQCGAAGTTTVNFTATDSCGNTATTAAILTIQDTTPPDLSNCSVTDQTLECSGTDNETIANDWNAANILALQSCPVDDCNTNATYTVTSDYDFANLDTTISCGAGGTIEVTYTGSDDCGNEASITATLTLEDSTPPDLTNCTVTNETLECNGSDNESIADAWNAANILALESCPVDDCDSDNTYSVTSDYNFSNLVSTCGTGGTIEVIYTGSDDCGNQASITATLTLEDSIGPDLTNCTTAVDQTLECNGSDNESIADAWNAANILALESCGSDSCDADALYSVTSDYDFANLASTCGLGGTIQVIYTVADDCGNSTNITATLTLEDSIGPDLTNCSVTDLEVECTATDNESIADAWNAANILALESCGSDSCDADALYSVTSDYDFNNLNTVCGPCGSITVTYTVADDCGNSTNITATLSFGDATGPDLANCNVVDQTLECNGTDNETISNAWDAANIAELEVCADDINVTISSDYAFANLVSTCGLGGTIQVTYTATDDCGNTSNVTATLTLEDSIGPDLTNCTTVVDQTLECNGSDNESIADAWNAANILALESCGSDSCDADALYSVTSDYAFANLVSTCGLGGTIQVIYTVADDCGNTSNVTATLTLEDSIGPDLTNCTTVVDQTLECNGSDNESIADAWNAANILALESCGSDSCDADALYSVTSDYAFANLASTCGLGGTIQVIYTVADDCGNSTNITATLTLEDSIGPDLTNCSVTDLEVECTATDNESIADAWNAANILALESCGSDSCDADALYSVTSDYDFNNLNTVCGPCGSITVTYTVADDCGNSTNITATLSFGDATGPDLANCNVVDQTLECNGTDNETIANAWDAANIAELEVCADDINVTISSDYAFANLVSTCGLGGTIQVTYTATDDCGNSSNVTATLTLEDSIGPDLTNCTTVVDQTLECNGSDNESIADAWNAANILALESCGSDSCDADALYSVTSDYAFANLASTCGLGGTIQVIYTVADDCGNTSNVTATLTLEDSIGPDLTNCTTVVDQTLECNGSDNESIADAWNAANILALESCGSDSCDADALYNVTSDYAFANLASTCGLGGTIQVIYTVADDCGNSTNITATLTLEDSIGPDLTNCSVTDLEVECTATDNESIADAWNQANILALESCGSDSCDADALYSVTSDYDFNNLNTVCGPCGSITVTYTVADDCGNSTNITATLSFGDATGPDLANCNVVDQTLECNGTDNETISNAWDAANIAELEVCADDINVTISSDYAFANLVSTCGLGGTIQVTYTATDDCGNTSNVTATLTLEDSIGPDLTNCTTVVDQTLECNGSDNESIADAWNAANILALESCGSDSCDADALYSVTSDYAFANLVSTCGLGGTIQVIYTVADDCGNTSNVTATLTLEDSIGPDLTNCTTVVDQTLECNGSDNESIADAWNAANILALESCGSDSCDADALYSVTSDYDFANLASTCGLGGTIQVIYTVADDCGNTTNITATLTLEDSIGPDLTNCSVTDLEVECTATDNESIADAWNAANILALESCGSDSCDADALYSVTSDYDFNNLNTVCGPCGSITVTYTVADDCGNSTNITATLSFGDATGPDLANCNVVDQTLECNGTDNETIANAWDAANIAELEVCADDINVTISSDYAFANLVSTCGLGGTIQVTYTATDDCGNTSNVTATLTLEDSIGPDLTNCTTVVDQTLECNGSDNESIADAWNAANILALESCGSDSCDADALYSVTSDYAFANLASTCGLGGTIQVIYTVADDCGNTTNITATLTLEDSIGPDLTNCTTVVDQTLECNGSDNESIADAWNAANILALESCGSDSCDADALYSVTSDYAFANLASTCGLGGTIQVIYTVADDCGNTTNITATLTLEDSIGPDLTNCSVTDLEVECTATDNESIADAWNQANILALESCGSDSCDADALYSVTSDYDFNNLNTVCGPCGSITVTYTVADDCGNSTNITATLSFGDATGPDLANCNVVDQTLECNGTDNETIANAWDAANIAELEVCADDINVTISSDYAFANLVSTCGLGGTIQVTYTATDDCGNTSNVTATLTLEDSIGPDLTNCTTVVDQTLECNGSDNESIADAWNAANILALESCGSDSCDADALYSVTSDYAFANLASTCGLGGTIQVIYTVADDCGNSTNITATLTLEDSIGPDLTNCTTVVDQTLECNGSDNESIADAWNAANILALESCGSDSCDADALYSVTSDYAFANLASTCGLGGTIQVIYTVADDCGNSTNITATLTLEDSIGPDLTNCSVTDLEVECTATDNESIADAWNAANILALESCGSDSCDADALYSVTSDYDFNNLNTVCGPCGSITVTYTVADDCGNSTNITATLSFGDATGPDLANCNVVDQTLECNGTDNETIANAWDAANIAELEVCADDINVTISSDYAFANLVSTCGLGGTIQVTYTATDDCGNSSNVTATLTLEDSIGPDLTNCTTVVDQTLECNGSDNESIADAWNAANILALESCGSDSCDADALYSVTSDYAFANLASTCGLGGTIQVIYTVADDCGNSTNITATLTLEDSIGPDLTNCTTVVDQTLECNGSDNESIADAWNAANILALESCGSDSCDADALYSVTSDYAFANLASTCGLGGTIQVIYTVADDCGNSTNITATLTLEDSIGPDLTNCSVTDLEVECTATDNESIADAWNAANILALESCGSDSCDADALYSVTSDYDFNNLNTVCGPCGSITVTYTVADDCGNSTNITATLSFGDATGPDLANCNVVDQTLECNGTDNETIANAWDAANIAELEVCADDINVTISSDYAFANLVSTCGLGGTIQVTYTATDDCGNSSNVTATLTLEDSIGPDLTNCTTVVDQTLECNGSDNESIADAWNAANILALESCGSDSCDADALYSVTSDYAFANLASTCGLGGTIQVIYTVADDCGNSTNITATLTLEDSIGPDLTNCTTVVDQTLECNGSDNESIADAWNAANILALESCGSDSCDADALYSVTSDYAFANLASTCGLGGTIQVIYTVADDCGNSTNITATLTLEDSIGPDLTNCSVTDLEVECTATDNESIADAWNAANILALESCGSDSCDADALYSVTSDYDFNNLNTVCGPCGSITVTYTVADDCGNSTNITATLSFGDATGPDLANCNVVDQTLECNGTDNETIANAWDAANIAELEVCADDINVTISSDYAFANLVSTCGLGGTIQVTYTATDDCGNSSNVTATLTLEDSIGPDLTNCTTVVDQTLECNGSDNESIADAWNAANILALESCGSDSCDADALYSVTSDYAFANLASTCGLGGTIQVIYTVADDCGNSTNITATLTLEDSIGPDLTNCTTVVDQTLECNGSDNESIADAWNAANILALESCGSDSCDADALYSVTSDYAFANLASTCGLGGTIQVIYTVADDCGNSTNITATLTLEDSTPPDLTICTEVIDETLECNGADNEAIADAWNQANIDNLQACPGDDCDADVTYTVTSDYDFANLDTSNACGNGGAIPVTYTVADDCDNESTITVTLTLEDSTPPDLTICTEVIDETLECNGSDNEAIADAWNQANIDNLQACPGDDCDADVTYTVTSDYDFANLDTSNACGNGGAIPVTYTVADDCDNESTITVTLTLEDTTPPDLTICTEVIDETLECNGADNEAIADAWNQANIDNLQACPGDDCDADVTYTVTSDYDFANLDTSNACGNGGAIPVTYTVADDCDNESTITVTLTLEDTTPPDLTICTEVIDETLECNGSDNEAIADAWNQANIDNLQACPGDDCDADITYTVTSDYDFANLDTSNACGNGGAIPVTYTVADDCDNESTITVTLTLEDTTPPDLTICTEVIDETLECNGADNEAIADAWNQANIDNLQACPGDDCDADVTYTVTSDYDFANLDTSNACGNGGAIPVTYTVADDCDNESTITVTLTLEDTTPPDLTICTEVIDETLECNGADNEAIADAWNQTNIDNLQACPGDDCDADITYTVTSNYDFANLLSTCGLAGSIAVEYTVADDCGNSATITAELTIVDTTLPSLENCNIVDTTMECNGDDNESIANQWNADNIAALEACAVDGCDLSLSVSSNFDFNNLVTTCGLGGTIDVIYTITDDCNNEITTTATLTLEDTTPPSIDACDVTDQTLECDGENNEAIADQWNAENIAALEACVADGCDNDFTGQVTSDYDFSNLSSAPGLGGMLDVEYTITDDCDNETVLYAMLTLENTSVGANDISICNTSEVEAQVLDLFDLLVGYYDDSGTWEVISGDAEIIDDHYFDPLSIELVGENIGVDIVFSYTENNSACPTYVEATVEVHNRCFVLTCGLDNVEISKAVTPNGDQWNEFFEVTGVELCGYTIDVKLFNRWGALIFESHDYQNDWNGTAHKNSIGGADTVPNGTYYYIVTLKDSGIDPINGYIYVGTK